MSKKDNLDLIRKHVFESFDYILEFSMDKSYKDKLKDPDTKMGDLGLQKNYLFFTYFETIIGAKINMTDFWVKNNAPSLTIKEFKELVFQEYLKIQEETQKSVTKRSISDAILKQYETLPPATLLALDKFIKDNSKKR